MLSGTTHAQGRSGLARLLDDAPMLLGLGGEPFGRELRAGLDFFNAYNDARLALAFGMFESPMRNAIFELIFLLHCNDPSLARWRFTAKRYESEHGKRKVVEEPRTIDLHVGGAPAGLKGIRELSPRLRGDYERYVNETFKMDPYGNDLAPAEYPIVALQAVGSTGTIGQKPGESDLDLQVIYETLPFSIDTTRWSDAVFADALNREYRLWLNYFSRRDKVTVEALQRGEMREALAKMASERLRASYPYLYRALTEKERAFAEGLARTNDQALRARVLREILALMTRAAQVARAAGGASARKRESLFKLRMRRIQEYVNAKFPEAEIYLFVYTVEHFRSGTYDSTLEFKESSGSAYEYILNYETLMPGIQLTPPVPVHFLLSERLNNSATAYDSAIECIRFGALEGFEAHARRLVDLGPATRLDTQYVARHGGAIYWEAFKASSGNLPKAMLNLLRFEMLLDERFLHTIIHLIKKPGQLDPFCVPKPADSKLLLRYEMQLGQMKTGLAGWAVLDLERRFPSLRQDPWWLRYKALKIAFEGAEGVPGIETGERQRLLNVIDLGFCLHLRIADVLTQSDQAPGSYREEVLRALLETAFPSGSSRRIYLDNLMSGDARGLISFEKEMRDLFQRSMTRVERKMSQLGIREHVGKKDELELWLNYYLENFQPQPHVVPRMIMKHLKTARVGIDISHRPGEDWVFMSIQRLARSGLPQRQSSRSRYLPERLTLFESPGFLTGLAHCILNGYIGQYPDAAGSEQRTAIEMERQRVLQEGEVHNRLAWLSAEQVEHLARRIAGFFPYQPVDYKAILRLERGVTGLFVCLNLFRFGRLSIVYRNNINTWFCEELELPDMQEISNAPADADVLIGAEAVHRCLSAFFQQHRIDPARVPIGAWLNPNSLAAGHGKEYHALTRDLEEGRAFRERILLRQGVDPRTLPKQPA